MRFPSNSLSIFRFFGGIQSPDDSDMDVASTITPTMEIPRAITQIDVTGPTIHDSALCSRTLERGPSLTGAGVTIATITPGLWDITLMWNYGANFATGAQFDILSGSLDGKNFSIMSIGLGLPSTGTYSNGVLPRQRIALNSNLQLILTVPSTGVSQSATCGALLIANRLG